MNVESIIHSSFLIIGLGFCYGSVTMSVERVGVSFEPVLLNKFDMLIKKRGYTNRSEAIRDLVERRSSNQELKKIKARSSVLLQLFMITK